MSVNQPLDPTSKRRSQPRDFDIGCIELPFPWNSEVVDHHNRVDDSLSHDNVSKDGFDNLMARVSDDAKNHLELFDFLSEERVEWDVHLRIEARWNLNSRDLLFVFDLKEVRW